ncbi:hypothetical protein GQ607_014697 [Colletotrichum asianum]|uniref:Uncharacterized protein n=1 Tax=Colletotrichum asianum TaxID=702518 RepID=A0A8H3W2Q4_9PEZI|nr:hypothetical protein GQ607_014697 [Colletotrichum asianum]
MFRNLFRGSQRAVTTVTRPGASRQTPMLCRQALIRQPRQSQQLYKFLAGSRPYSSQSKIAVNNGTDANGEDAASDKSDNTTQRGIVCRVAASAERKKRLALIDPVPERAGRQNQLARIHRVPPRIYRKYQLVLPTTRQMIQMEKNALEIVKALREISAKLDMLEKLDKLDKINMNLDKLDNININLEKIIINLDKAQKQDKYAFWTLVFAIIVMAFVVAMSDPEKPDKEENEAGGEIQLDTRPTSKADPDRVS